MSRVAVVTGGTQGIGAAISEALKDAGFKVAAVYAGNDEKAQAFKSRTGIAVYKWDVSDVDESAKGLKQVEADLGAVDVLINNAGIARDSMFHKMTFDQWKAVMNTNLDSMFAMTRPVIEGMRARGFGRIVNISSINGQKGQMGQANYSASKAGIIGFTKSLALENASKNVTVNAVCPGYINTDMMAAIPEEVLKKIIATIPAGRLGDASEVAAAVLYLVSDKASFMTGAVMTLNGAQYLANG